MILNEPLTLYASESVILTLFPIEGRELKKFAVTSVRNPSLFFCLPAANSNVVQILSSAACWNGSFLEKK